MVAAIGWTGHAFPAFALARELGARGHEVTVESFERWRDAVEGLGLRFAAAPEQLSFPGIAGERGARRARPWLEAARELGRPLADLDPTSSSATCSRSRRRWRPRWPGCGERRLIPHPYPAHDARPALLSARACCRRARHSGALAWRAMWPAVGTRLPNTRLRTVRAALDATRAELGLGPLRDYDGQISEQLALVATFPQLEYPRRWPAHVQVTGPMPFELPHPEVELPGGDDPLVVVASSTERDPGLGSCERRSRRSRASRCGCSRRPTGRARNGPVAVPANAAVVDWLSYAQVMPRAALVVCHGGHGTIARALGEGVPVLVCPPAGDMAENGARVSWAGRRADAPGPADRGRPDPLGGAQAPRRAELRGARRRDRRLEPRPRRRQRRRRPDRAPRHHSRR